MTEYFPSSEGDVVPTPPADEQYLGDERYVNAAEVMQTLGDALCDHPNVQELDKLQLSVPTQSGGQAVIDSYWMYMARGAEGGMDAGLHRTLLREGSGLIRAGFSRGDAEFSYNVARPNALLPGTATKHFAALLDRPFEEISDAVVVLARGHRLKDDGLRVTAAELCAQLGEADIALTLDEPRVFIWNTAPGKTKILLPTPDYAIHHENLREIVEALRIPPTE